MEKTLHDLARRIGTLTDDDFFAILAVKGNFSVGRPHPAVFFCALTLHSLLRVPDPTLIPVSERLAAILRAERRDLGSWKYWRQASEEAKTRPLPDDLDTTSCALAALADMPGEIPVEWVAQFAHFLTLREVQPGGPYRTWIVPADADAVWQDVDPVVNANIARFLHRYAAVPEPLLRFLREAILDRSRTSPYYPGRAAFRYFLASWYQGEARLILAEECIEALRNAIQGGSLQELAFSLASASAFEECDIEMLRAGAEKLARLCQHRDIQPEAVCIDALHEGVPDHAGSLAFTLALAHEALFGTRQRLAAAAVPRRAAEEAEDAFARCIVAETCGHCEKFPTPLRSVALVVLDEALAGDRNGNLTKLPFAVARAAAGSSKLYAEEHLDIGAAHLAGWVAYSLYDDVADRDRQSTELWTANALARLSWNLFSGLFPADAAWLKKCEETFARMDAMNLEEQRAWTLSGTGPIKRLPSVLPTLSFAMLTERSIGAVLAPLALVKRAGGAAVDTLCKDVEQFLLHLIAARQLSDDAHDWQDDLMQGRLNSTSCRLFPAARAGTPIDLTGEMEALRRAFWESTLPEIAADVRAQCDVARTHAMAFLDSNPEAFAERMLKPLVESMDKAIRERDLTKSFLESYQKL